jgi:hypothetical protein
MSCHRIGSLICEFYSSDRNKVLTLLVRRIAQLPQIPKKVLAMYYYENLRPEATGFGLTANEIELIHTQTVRLLRNKLIGDLKQSDRST